LEAESDPPQSKTNEAKRISIEKRSMKGIRT